MVSSADATGSQACVLEGNRSYDGCRSWESIKKKMREFYGAAVYDSWLSSLSYKGEENGKVVLAVPTRFIKEWILVHYMDRILKLWQAENNLIYCIDICIENRDAVDSPAVGSSGGGLRAPVISDSMANQRSIGSYEHLSSPLDPRFTFDNFVSPWDV